MGASGRRVGQVASPSAANADPPSAANKIKRQVVDTAMVGQNVQTMVGHKLAKARFHKLASFSPTLQNDVGPTEVQPNSGNALC